MPIYEYQCQNCGEALEVLQKLSDAPLIDCPSCGKPQLKKKVSAAAFRLKGGGWYETDFKTGDNKKNLAGGDSATKESKSAEPAKKDGGSGGNTPKGGDKTSSGKQSA